MWKEHKKRDLNKMKLDMVEVNTTSKSCLIGISHPIKAETLVLLKEVTKVLSSGYKERDTFSPQN